MLINRMIRLLALVVSFAFLSGCRHESLVASKAKTIRVDSVYAWLTHMQQPNGLLLSSEGGQNVSLYDNALAALVFTSYGDYHRAEKIFDFFDSRVDAELKVSPGGFGQMRTLDGLPVDNQPRRWLGDNAWLLIALNNYHHLAKNTKYQHLASELTRWIVSLQDTDGGIWGGFNADGSRISKIAEGNLDAFNAIEGYTDFHKNLLYHFSQVRWDQTDRLLIAWADNPPYKYAMDLHPWGYCVFEDFPVSVLTQANRYLTTQRATATNKMITGYSFDQDRDVVWLEGTGQMVVAFIKAGNESEAKKYLRQMKKNLVQSPTFPHSFGLPYTSNYGSSYADDVLWTGVDTNPAVSSTAWYLFGHMRFDPFQLGYVKNIPMKDKFWIP